MAELEGKKRRGSKSILEKYKILKEVEQGTSCSAIARKYGIAKQTLSNWIKDKYKIFATVDANNTTAVKRKRFRQSPHHNVDQACYKWLLCARHKNIPISGNILKTKAIFFAKELGVDSFQASNGWMDRWKQRYNLSFKTISGMILSYTCLQSSLLRISIFLFCLIQEKEKMSPKK